MSTTSAALSTRKMIDARQAIAAEAVRHLDRETLRGEALHLGRGAADAGGVHLVGALRELRHPVGLGGLHRRDRDL